MENFNYRTPFLFIGVVLIVSLIGCKDDNLIADLLPYDSSSHVYGTFDFKNNSRWEVVIDPRTGQFDTIPGTRRSGSGFSLPIGVTDVTAFNENKRIFIDFTDKQNLIIQDLETSDYSMLQLRDSSLNKSVINPQRLRFGADDNEFNLSEKSLFKRMLPSHLLPKSTHHLILILVLPFGAARIPFLAVNKNPFS